MRLRPLLFVPVLAALAACSELHVTPTADVHAMVDGQAYQLLVKTDKPDSDRMVYELAREVLGPCLPLKEKEPFTGVVEILFSSTQAISSTSLSVGYASDGGGWYSGGSATGVAVENASPRTYYNGTLLVVVKNAAGERVWSADYQHKGRWSLSSDSPESVARAGLRKAAEALRRAIGIQKLADSSGGPQKTGP